MKEDKIREWEATRKGGKWRFVLKQGVLRWGVVTALLFSILMHFVQPQEPIWLRPLISIVVFPLGGILFGYWLWAIGERNYRKWQQSQGDT
jgi:hypothetical protein